MHGVWREKVREKDTQTPSVQSSLHSSVQGNRAFPEIAHQIAGLAGYDYDYVVYLCHRAIVDGVAVGGREIVVFL